MCLYMFLCSICIDTRLYKDINKTGWLMGGRYKRLAWMLPGVVKLRWFPATGEERRASQGREAWAGIGYQTLLQPFGEQPRRKFENKCIYTMGGINKRDWGNNYTRAWIYKVFERACVRGLSLSHGLWTARLVRLRRVQVAREGPRMAGGGAEVRGRAPSIVTCPTHLVVFIITIYQNISHRRDAMPHLGLPLPGRCGARSQLLP